MLFSLNKRKVKTNKQWWSAEPSAVLLGNLQLHYLPIARVLQSHKKSLVFLAKAFYSYKTKLLPQFQKDALSSHGFHFA